MGFDPDREPPFFFCKPADAVVPVAAGETLNLAYPAQTDNYHYEIELVVAIGKKGSDIRWKKPKSTSGLRHRSGYDPPRPSDGDASDGPSVGNRQGV